MERKISRKGGVTIPAQLRRVVGIHEREKIDIEILESGDILLKRIQGHCVFCDRTENIESYRGRFVCERCKEELGGK